MANKESAIISYIDDTNKKNLSTVHLTGDYGTTDNYRTKSSIDAYISMGYKLISDNYSSNGVIYNKSGIVQNFEVHLKHDTSDEMETRTITRTIHYKYLDGRKTLNDYNAQLVFKRNIIIDNVSGNRSYGEWLFEDKTYFKSVVIPFISGFVADKPVIPKVSNITGATKDIEIYVTFNKLDNNKEKIAYFIQYT